MVAINGMQFSFAGCFVRVNINMFSFTYSCYQLVTDSILGTVNMEKLWERNFALSRTSQVSITTTKVI